MSNEQNDPAVLGPVQRLVRPGAEARKLCTCDGAGRGPGRPCVVQAGGRLGDLWCCAIEAKAIASPLRDTVTTTLRTEQMPDGSWCAHMLVTGLPNERTADAAMTHMQLLFCGKEIGHAS